MDLDVTRQEMAREVDVGQADLNVEGRFHGARRVIIAAGASALRLEYSAGLSLGDVLVHAANAPPTPDRRNFAALVIGALAVDGLIPSTNQRADIDRIICSLAEGAVPQLLNRFRYPFRGQTYEKRRALEGLHASVVELLRPLATPTYDLSGLLGARTKLTKCLTDSAVETYFGPPYVQGMRDGVQRVFEAFSDLGQEEDAAFHGRLRVAEEAVARLKDILEGRAGEIASAVAGFLGASQQVLSSLIQETASRLVSEISTARPEPRVAAKRYPLHEEGRELTVLIPLANKGPGWAYDVTVQGVADSDTIYVDGEALKIGDFRPGEIPIALRVLVCEPCREASMLLDVSWRMAGSPVRQSRAFSVRLEAQRADVDWIGLENRSPYNIAVAEGPRFVGRVARVRAISNRFTREVMESVLIDGQKRVGKSSLALAVRDAVVSQRSGTHTSSTANSGTMAVRTRLTQLPRWVGPFRTRCCDSCRRVSHNR